MNKQKQLPNVKLQKTSVIFMQLGLILALFSVYLIIEHETFYKPYAINVETTNVDPDENPTIRVFEIEKTPKQKSATKKKTKQVIHKQEPKPSETFETVKDEDKRIETAVLDTTEDDQKTEVKITLDDIDEVDLIEIPDEEIPFNAVEFAPEFPGCKGSKEQKKQCFSEKVRKIVQRNFNTELAQELGLDAGKKRINVQFVIDKEGNITDIKARAPHKRLEKEAKRVIKLLPKMKAARQGNGFAKVKFGLPILFMVED
jgi:protein TonB